MTKAQIISQARYLINEVSTDTGALLDDTGNLEDFVHDATEQLVLDLVPYMPSQFIQTKTIDLVADQANYSLAETITGTTIAFVDSDPDTITDSGNGFVTAGFEQGMTITVSGAATAANNADFTIASVVAGTITLITADALTAEAAGASVTITQKDPFWQVYKVSRNVTNKSPREISIIDPLQIQFEMNVGDTEASPDVCWPQGDELHFAKTPSTSTSGYVKVFLIRPESIEIAEGGPVLIPRPFHRCIGYMAAALASIFCGTDPSKHMGLYQNRLRAGKRVWFGRFQQQPRFVKESHHERRYIDEREKAFYDLDWLD